MYETTTEIEERIDELEQEIDELEEEYSEVYVNWRLKDGDKPSEQAKKEREVKEKIEAREEKIKQLEREEYLRRVHLTEDKEWIVHEDVIVGDDRHKLVDAEVLGLDDDAQWMENQILHWILGDDLVPESMELLDVSVDADCVDIAVEIDGREMVVRGYKGEEQSNTLPDKSKSSEEVSDTDLDSFTPATN